MKDKKSLIWHTLIILFVIGFDQLTKYLTVKLLALGESFPIIEGVIHFTHWINRGAAFGMLANHRWVFMLISTLLIVALAVYLYLGKCPNLLYSISISMIIGGGIGNMIDRVYLGYVIDFIDFTLIDFAIFNIADSFVCVGAGLLVLALLLDIIKEAKAAKK